MNSENYEEIVYDHDLDMLTILSTNRMFYILGEVGVELKVFFLGPLRLVGY